MLKDTIVNVYMYYSYKQQKSCPAVKQLVCVFILATQTHIYLAMYDTICMQRFDALRSSSHAADRHSTILSRELILDVFSLMF